MYTHTIVGARDARADLGYGTTKPKYQLPRSRNKSYPYLDPDSYEESEDLELEDEEIDNEDILSVRKKSLGYMSGDSLAGNKTDPLYFVGGNTKLSDCFWRTEKVLNEIAAFGDSMMSVPQAYRGKGPSLTGYGPAFPYQGGGGSSYRRIGSLRGWSQQPPPPQVALDMEDDEKETEEEHIYTLRDLSKKLGDE